MQRLTRATGKVPAGWLGPECGESTRGAGVLAEAGIRYVCNWVNDEQPCRLHGRLLRQRRRRGRRRALGHEQRPRAASLERLEAGEADVIFAVDMFNGGVDLPHVDTIMMLRPTESSIVWMQQFGRGLRKVEHKDRSGSGPEECRQHPREAIPPLFGLAYSAPVWNQGFIFKNPRWTPKTGQLWTPENRPVR